MSILTWKMRICRPCIGLIMDPLAFFIPCGQDTLSDKRIYVLTSYESFDELASLDEKLSDDSQYQEAGASYINAAHDNPTFREIETILLRAFSHAPQLMNSGLEAPKTERIYELRSYESATEAQNINKVEMFNEGGEVELFDKLNFNAIFYGNVIAGSDMPNLIYMVSFEDMEARDNHWSNFSNAPAWKELSSMEKYQNNVSHIDNYFLRATEYSDL
ncbi:MAG: NIPSNAP family protein [Balneolaceae bacterium]|nr:NIPSNAP family protein [Balneolaceae bacterium]